MVITNQFKLCANLPKNSRFINKLLKLKIQNLLENETMKMAHQYRKITLFKKIFFHIIFNVKYLLPNLKR